jgi:predicted AAA+ superfamily ATPase
MNEKYTINRLIEPQIRRKQFRGRAIIVVGPRRVGKTTLLKQIASDIDPEHLWLDCDEPDILTMLTDAISTRLKAMIGKAKILESKCPK